MNEDTNTTPASSVVAKRPIWQSIPLIHLILAGIIVVFSLLGYIPANERPEANTTELRSYPEGSTAEQKTKIDEENKKISKDNEEAEKKAAEAAKKWEKSGRENMESWLSFCRFTAAVAAVLWVGFVIISYLLRPMLAALSRMLGADFAAVLSPLVLIGIFSALAVVTNTAVNQFLPKSAGFLASFQAIVFSIVTPVCSIILEFRDFILKNWMVSVAYLLVVLFVVLKKFFKTNEG